MPRSRSRWARIALVTLVALFGWSCAKEVAVPEPVIRPVRIHRVEASDSAEWVAYAGVAKAGIESRLSFRVAGTVVQVPVKVGDRVRRGTVLARLDTTDYELSVQQSEASVAQARAGLRQAEADYDRSRALYENNNASKAELDAKRAAAESATAQVEAAQKGLDQARQQVAYTRLAAPMSGAIAAVDVEVNENVSAGQALFQVSSDTPPEVEIRVPEVAIGQIRAGQPAEVAFDALPGRTLGATVTEVGVSAGGSATFPVTLRIDEGDEGIRSGMAAEVRLQVGTIDTNNGDANTGDADAEVTIRVPLVAVGEDQNGRFVFVVENDRVASATVRRRPVEVGDLGEGGLRILSGLEVGEVVVTAGVRRLVDGMEVRAIGAGEAP